MAVTDFRYDINGLRAWAVIAVILYHFNVPGFASGFVGVDIFFVISGYLMTGIIIRKLEEGRDGGKGFSLIDFYLSRARRIIPALAAVAFVLLVLCSYFVPVPFDYRSLGSEVLFALFFLSNYKYWLNPERAGGYFADMDAPRWLLHSWSLSAEWQFYLILPVILIAVWKLAPSRLSVALLLLILAALSFTSNVLTIRTDAELAFYSLHTRAWEMLAGGLIYLWPARFAIARNWSRLVEGLGFTVILASIFLSHPVESWPGWRATLPVLGSMLVLLANRQSSIWTSTAFAQAVGTLSYSLYLWHWPLVMTLAYVSVEASPFWTILALLATIPLSIASYFFIEQRARRSLHRKSRVSAVLALSAVLAVPATAGLVIRQTDGLPQRLSDDMRAITLQQSSKDHRKYRCSRDFSPSIEECIYGGEKLGVVLIGDSHAKAIASAVKDSLDLSTWHILDMTIHACQTILDGRPATGKCPSFLNALPARLDTISPAVPVVLVNRGLGNPEPEQIAEWRHTFVQSLCKMSQKHDLYVTRPIPEMTVQVPRYVAFRKSVGIEADVSILLEDHEKHNAVRNEALDEAAKECGIRILDPVPYLCSDGRCLGTKDGIPLYSDDDHLSQKGASLLVPMFKQIWLKE